VQAARFGGFIAYGQSRTGGYPPPKGTTAFFANPNVRNEWIGNRVTEGLRADHQGGPINISGSFGDLVKSNGNAFVLATTWAPSFNRGCAARTVGSVFSEIGCRGMNRLLSFRRNSVDSCGGFQIGSSTDVLLERNRVHGTPGSSIGLNSTGSPFQISAGAMGCISRGNVHDGVEAAAPGDKGAALLKTDDAANAKSCTPLTCNFTSKFTNLGAFAWETAESTPFRWRGRDYMFESIACSNQAPAGPA
jgi:hypothetical protein